MENILISSSETELKIESGVEIENGSKVYSTLERNVKFQLATTHCSGFKNNTADFKIETLNPDNNSRKRPFGFDHHHPGHSGKRVDGSDFVENGLDPELCFGITFRRIGAGLENLGNTCFLNSVVQCLTYTEPLAAYLQSGKHQNSSVLWFITSQAPVFDLEEVTSFLHSSVLSGRTLLSFSSILNSGNNHNSCHVAGFCALCAIQKHVSRALQSSGRSLVPKDLVSNLRCISQNFRNARQEDAHEYMVNLLESMHKCCLPSGVPSESPAAYETSLVHKIFGGSLRSQVECQQCSYCSNKFDPFLDLSLEIARADTLPALLWNFTAAEMLDGGEKHYQCQRCKQKVRAKKRLTVHKAPHVLTIHLKRFHAHDPGRKVGRKVIFDRSLDMKPYVSGSYVSMCITAVNYHSSRLDGVSFLSHLSFQVSNRIPTQKFYTGSNGRYLALCIVLSILCLKGDVKYSLYGVLVHYGHNTHSGHYVCFVRTSSGIWHLLNDNQVRQVSEKAVLEQKAYMLFYVRDRKTIVSRKPCRCCSKRNSLTGNRLGATDSSAAMNKKDASSVVTSSEIHPKGTSQKTLLKVDSSLETSTIELLLNLKHASIITEAKTSDCKEPSSRSSAPQSSAIDKLVTRETSQKINADRNAGVSSQAPYRDSCGKTVGEVPRLAPSEGCTDKAFDKSDTVKSPNKPGCESDQGGNIPIESTDGKTLSDKAGEDGQYIGHHSVEGLIPTESVPSVIQNECLQSKAPDCLPKKILKNKLLKSRMHFGTNLFKVSLGLRKSKKHKKSNCHAWKTDNLITDNLLQQLENDVFFFI
ncbi:hypothetical protein OIU78_002495 [Salix suchowensis]|nr:hypothetical protein OIU78_002495 [Salix suchowensis]